MNPSSEIKYICTILTLVTNNTINTTEMNKHLSNTCFYIYGIGGQIWRSSRKACLLSTTLVILFPFSLPPWKRGKNERRMNKQKSSSKVMPFCLIKSEWNESCDIYSHCLYYPFITVAGFTIFRQIYYCCRQISALEDIIDI